MNQSDCKIFIGHDFNNTHKDYSAVAMVVTAEEGTVVVVTILGRDSEGVFDLTSALHDIGYRVIRENSLFPTNVRERIITDD